MKTCESCVFFDRFDELTFWCDIQGACTMDNVTPCSRYIPVDNKEEEE